VKETNLQQLRDSLETQFRLNFYQDPKFPYLHSVGIKDVFQSFESNQDNVGFIGVLHLWWVNEDNNIVYDKPTAIKPKGVWHSEWLESAEEGIERAQSLMNQNKIFKPEALMEAILKANMKIAERIQKKQLRLLQEEDLEEEIPTYMLN
jgi:peptide subunit release factor RF-3